MIIEIRSRFQTLRELWSGNRLVQRDPNRLVWVRGEVEKLHVEPPTWVQVPVGNFSMHPADYWRLRFEQRTDGLFYMLEYSGSNVAINWRPWNLSRMWSRERFTMYWGNGGRVLDGWWLDYRTLDAGRDIMSLIDSRMTRMTAIQEAGSRGFPDYASKTDYQMANEAQATLKDIQEEITALQRELTLYRMGAPIPHE